MLDCDFSNREVIHMGEVVDDVSEKDMRGVQIRETLVSHFDTSNVKEMNRMFESCKALTSLDLSKFDTSNVTYMNDMFYGCENLTSFNQGACHPPSVTGTPS